MEPLTIAFLIVVVALAVTILIVWDRLVGIAFGGVVVGAAWMVAQSAGRWWYWPAAIAAAAIVLAALVVAVLIS